MGYIPIPYAVVRTFYHAEEFILGKSKEVANPFGLDNIVLKLPG